MNTSNKTKKSLLTAMLNYYEISLGSSKDEQMSASDKKKFIKILDQRLDEYAIEEFLEAIHNRDLDSPLNDIDDDSDELDSHINELDYTKFDGMMPINPEIEKFVNWMLDTLYSANHSINIKKTNDSIIITLKKIPSGDK